jgi:hypothetical protein
VRNQFFSKKIREGLATFDDSWQDLVDPAINNKKGNNYMNIIRITLATIALGFSFGLVGCSKAPEGDAPAPEAPAAAEPAAPAEAPAQ